MKLEIMQENNGKHSRKIAISAQMIRAGAGSSRSHPQPENGQCGPRQYYVRSRVLERLIPKNI